MELVLRDDDGCEAGRELKLTASLQELLRRIETTMARNPKDILAYQVAQEIAFQMRNEDLIGQLISELVQQAGVRASNEPTTKRDPKWARNSEIRAIGTDSSESVQPEEPESCVA